MRRFPRNRSEIRDKDWFNNILDGDEETRTKERICAETTLGRNEDYANPAGSFESGASRPFFRIVCGTKGDAGELARTKGTCPRTIVPARIARATSPAGRAGRGKALEGQLNRNRCFPFARRESSTPKMNAIISLRGKLRAESLIEIHYSRYIFVGLQGLQAREREREREMEGPALSLTNCLLFVTGPTNPFRDSILEIWQGPAR